MIEKYGTYLVFQNKKTKEIKRIPIDEPLEKLASDEWEELLTDPEISDENKREEKESR